MSSFWLAKLVRTIMCQRITQEAKTQHELVSDTSIDCDLSSHTIFPAKPAQLVNNQP